jgi:hypothetical protein
MKGITLYDGDYVSEPGSEIIRTVTWINGAYYLVAKRADKELDSVRIDAADTMLHRGNIFQGLA